jgi:hypothetical protein
MPTTAAVLMIVILGIVWGGFVTILGIALRKERHKRSQPS